MHSTCTVHAQYMQVMTILYMYIRSTSTLRFWDSVFPHTIDKHNAFLLSGMDGSKRLQRTCISASVFFLGKESHAVYTNVFQ